MVLRELRWACAALTLLLQSAIVAQTFQRLYGTTGNERGQDVLVLPDGGLLMNGSTTGAGPGTENLVLLRTDALGNILWSRTYGGSFNEVGLRARVMPSGGFAVLALTDNSFGGLRDHYLLRLDDVGDVVWSRVVGGAGNDDPADLLVLPDGGFLLVGNSGTFGSRRVLVARLNAQGDLLWTIQPGGALFDSGFAAAPASDGGFLVVGTTEALGPGQRDMLVLRLNASGTILWSRTYGGSGSEQAFGVSATGADWTIAARSTTFGTGPENVVLLRIDDTGALLWSRVYGTTQALVGRSMVAMPDGGFAMAGALLAPAPGQDAAGVLAGWNQAGDLLWSNTYGPAGTNSDLFGLHPASNGLVAIGAQGNPGGAQDIWSIRTNLDGASGCAQSELSLTTSDIVLTVSIPTPLNSTLGITSTPPATITGSGIQDLGIICLDVSAAIPAINSPARWLTVYPNPSSDRILIDAPLRNTWLELYDGVGRLVHVGTLSSPVLPVDHLAPGPHLGVLIGDGEVVRFRFIKE